MDYLPELVKFWRNKYNWRDHEARLNKLPQFKTNVDGIDLHFVHARVSMIYLLCLKFGSVCKRLYTWYFSFLFLFFWTLRNLTEVALLFLRLAWKTKGKTESKRLWLLGCREIHVTSQLHVTCMARCRLWQHIIPAKPAFLCFIGSNSADRIKLLYITSCCSDHVVCQQSALLCYWALLIALWLAEHGVHLS